MSEKIKNRRNEEEARNKKNYFFRKLISLRKVIYRENCPNMDASDLSADYLKIAYINIETFFEDENPIIQYYNDFGIDNVKEYYNLKDPINHVYVVYDTRDAQQIELVSGLVSDPSAAFGKQQIGMKVEKEKPDQSSKRFVSHSPNRPLNPSSVPSKLTSQAKQEALEGGVKTGKTPMKKGKRVDKGLVIETNRFFHLSSAKKVSQQSQKKGMFEKKNASISWKVDRISKQVGEKKKRGNINRAAISRLLQSRGQQYGGSGGGAGDTSKTSLSKFM